jgi:hypothetical protein
MAVAYDTRDEISKIRFLAKPALSKLTGLSFSLRIANLVHSRLGIILMLAIACDLMGEFLHQKSRVLISFC